jgi:hypothetical protein
MGNVSAPNPNSLWITVEGGKFRKDQIQGFDAEYFPASSLGGPHGDYAFLWLTGKETPVRIPLHTENRAAFLARMETELAQIPIQPTTVVVPVQGAPRG